MFDDDSHTVALALIRGKLQPRIRPERPLTAVAAAAFFAISALTFATAAVLAPANVTTPVAHAGVK